MISSAAAAGSSFGGFLAALLILAVLVFGVSQIDLSEISLDVPSVAVHEEVEVSFDYASIPLTEHAQNAHEGQMWNAVSIQAFFQSQGCKPQIDECPRDDIDIHWCPVNGDKSIGLIIGRTVRQIVTGFMADTNWWGSRCPAN